MFGILLAGQLVADPAAAVALGVELGSELGADCVADLMTGVEVGSVDHQKGAARRGAHAPDAPGVIAS